MSAWAHHISALHRSSSPFYRSGHDPASIRCIKRYTGTSFGICCRQHPYHHCSYYYDNPFHTIIIYNYSKELLQCPSQSDAPSNRITQCPEHQRQAKCACCRIAAGTYHNKLIVNLINDVLFIKLSSEDLVLRIRISTLDTEVELDLRLCTRRTDCHHVTSLVVELEHVR